MHYPGGSTKTVCGLEDVNGGEHSRDAYGCINVPKVVDILPQLPAVQIYLDAEVRRDIARRDGESNWHVAAMRQVLPAVLRVNTMPDVP